MKIGVFDSGIGGLSVANAIKRALPEHEIIFKNDAEHVPYGTKTMDEVLAFALPVLRSLADDGVACIVVACNTVSTNLLGTLTKLLPVPLIGVEPMLPEAAELTKSKVIAVCATPATLASPRYLQQKTEIGSGIDIVEPDCSDWAGMIERSEIDQQQIAHRMQRALHEGADVIVLGCTHYHWIEEEIYRVVNGLAVVVQPEEKVVGQVRQLLGL